MRRPYRALVLVLCAVMLFPTLTFAEDTGGKTILTLEEAKKIALENDTQYKIQDTYVKERKENYNNMAGRYTGNSKGANVAVKAANRINSLVSLDSAYKAIATEEFNKKDLKRKSDYNVTTAYYGVMKAKYELDNKARAMELARKDLEIGKIQLDIGVITKTTLSQLENAYKSAQATYNAALADYENSMHTLSNEIGKPLDVNQYDVDMTIGIPITSTLDLQKLKEDNLKNNSSFFGLKNSLDAAKYRKSLVEQEYEDYTESVTKTNKNITDEFDNMAVDAGRDYDNAEFQYNEAVKTLELNLKSQLAAISSMQESIANIRKSYENARTTMEQNKVKYELGLLSRNAYEKSESAFKDVYNQLQTAIINLNSQYLALTQYSTAEK